MDWLGLLQIIGGIISGFGIASFTKAGRTKAKADAYAAMASAYDERINALHIVIDNNNKAEIERSERIAALNHSLNDKTERIRKLTDDLYDSQKELNRANEKITDLTQDLADERARKEYYRRWRCEKSICHDHEGRRPPNSKLQAEIYKDPEL